MAREVGSKQSELSAFGCGFVFLFASVVFFFSALLPVGCESPDSEVAGVGRVGEMPTEKSKAELLKSLDRKFENPDAHFELGLLYQAEGLWPKAEYHYNVALSFDPTHREAQAAMVKLFLERGDAAKSKTYAEIYMNQVANSADHTLRLGLAFQRQELDEYALACYQRALDLAPNSAKVHKRLGYYYLSKNDKVRATEYLSRSFQLDPNQPEVAGELGRLGVEVRIPGGTETVDETGQPSDKGTEQI